LQGWAINLVQGQLCEGRV